ncbi:MAG: DUF2769 domain-containing protein [Methanomassiliicoccales archaeon]|jgi:hypothetical protein
MDMFEDAMADWAKLSEADKKKLEKQRKDHCLCPTCPTYADCAKKKKELTFCFGGKSSCITISKGCHCSGCPVKVDFGLTNIYFCLNGTEQEIRSGQ